MSRSRWVLVAALLLSVGFNLGLLIPRIGESERPEKKVVEQPRFRPMIERIARELELTEDQRPLFADIQRQFFEATIAARNKVDTLQVELRTELVQVTPDRGRIESVLEQLADAHVDLERAFVDSLFASKEVLDPRQERRFKRFLSRLRQSRRDNLSPTPGARLRRLRPRAEGSRPSRQQP